MSNPGQKLYSLASPKSETQLLLWAPGWAEVVDVIAPLGALDEARGLVVDYATKAIATLSAQKPWTDEIMLLGAAVRAMERLRQPASPETFGNPAWKPPTQYSDFYPYDLPIRVTEHGVLV